MSVSSPRGSARTVPSRSPRTGPAMPTARARRTTKARRPASATALLRLDPEVDDREVPREIDQVPGERVHGERVAERAQPLRVRVHERLLRRPQGGEGQEVASVGAGRGRLGKAEAFADPGARLAMALLVAEHARDEGPRRGERF